MIQSDEDVATTRIVHGQAKLASFPVEVGLFALLAGMWAGLVRLGWALPTVHPALPLAHGPLMVSGFLGTLISLERAVALGSRWAYAAPLLTGLGGLVQIGGAGVRLITLGSAGSVAIFLLLFRRQPVLHTASMALGALTWLVGNGLWLAGAPIHSIVVWWAGFLLLTIAGERLELSRVARLSSASRAGFLIIVVFLLLSLTVATASARDGTRLAGAAMIALSLWLMRYDIARYTVRQAGLPRYIAMNLLSGYAWLGVAGLLWLWFGRTTAGPRYDAMLHAFFIGFVLAMIFGHAPIVVPAVLRRPMPFHQTFYVHVLVLHLSLALRLAGDLAGNAAMRQWGGLLNVCALLIFLGNTVIAMRPAFSRAIEIRPVRAG